MSSSYMIQCSYSHFFISALALSPLLGAKLCWVLALFHVTGCKVKLKGKTDTKHIKFHL